MPGMNGLVLIEEAPLRFPALPVLLLGLADKPSTLPELITLINPRTVP